MSEDDRGWPLLRRRARELPPPSAPQPQPQPQPQPPPHAPRPATVQHHWLKVVVARPGPHRPLGVPGARVVVRPFPKGDAKPGEAVGKGVTGDEGSLSFLLPPGRYVVSASAGRERHAATILLLHEGTATLLLASQAQRVTIHVEASREDGSVLADAVVEAYALPSGVRAARATTDERGLVALQVPPGSYEVRLGAVVVKTFVETDTVLRICAEAPPQPAGVPVLSRYAQRARLAVAYVAPLRLDQVRDDMAN